MLEPCFYEVQLIIALRLEENSDRGAELSHQEASEGLVYGNSSVAVSLISVFLISEVVNNLNL